MNKASFNAKYNSNTPNCQSSNNFHPITLKCYLFNQFQGNLLLEVEDSEEQKKNHSGNEKKGITHPRAKKLKQSTLNSVKLLKFVLEVCYGLLGKYS